MMYCSWCTWLVGDVCHVDEVDLCGRCKGSESIILWDERVCFFVLHGDSSMDYVAIQFSSLLYAHCRHDWCCHCINSVNLQKCNCLSGLINDLARAIWRWTEKKILWDERGRCSLGNTLRRSLSEKWRPLGSTFRNCANNQEVQCPSTSCQKQQHTTNVISSKLPKDIFSEQAWK